MTQKGKREVDARKTRRALRKLQRIKKEAEDSGRELSDWEAEFARSVEERLTTFGSAFRDLSKGRAEEPLSALQARKLREIERKAAGRGADGGEAERAKKARKPLRARKPWRSRRPMRRSGASGGEDEGNGQEGDE